MDTELLAEEFAQNLLSWKNSGFSIDNSVRLTDAKSKESLAEYIARPPLSLKKIRSEPFKGKVLFHTSYSDYFRPTHRVGREPCTSSMRGSSAFVSPLSQPSYNGNSSSAWYDTSIPTV